MYVNYSKARGIRALRNAIVCSGFSAREQPPFMLTSVQLANITPQVGAVWMPEGREDPVQPLKNVTDKTSLEPY